LGISATNSDLYDLTQWIENSEKKKSKVEKVALNKEKQHFNNEQHIRELLDKQLKKEKEKAKK